VKPANLLVRKEATGWKVKIIDFGLAMPQKVVETSQKGSTVRQKETMIGSSIAGTLDYGAPEQMGRRKEPVGPYSDVYGWAKTCCYALFQTTQPLLKHWKSVPEPLAGLLEKCLEEDPKQRPAGFAEVLKGLGNSPVAPSAPAPVVPQQEFDFERPEREAGDAPGGRTTRKKPKKNLLPWVLGGAGLLAVALIVVVAVLLGGQKKEGPKLVERGNKEPADQVGVTKPSSDKEEREKDGKQVAKVAPPVGRLPKKSEDHHKLSDKEESKKDGPPAKLDRQTKKDEFSVGKGTLVITTTVVNDRQVRFVFVARNFGTDYSPLTNWLNTNQGFYRRKLEELGRGTGTWQQTNLTWPPKLSNQEATFDVTFERK
jgi:hypothetical protein